MGSPAEKQAVAALTVADCVTPPGLTPRASTAAENLAAAAEGFLDPGTLPQTAPDIVGPVDSVVQAAESAPAEPAPAGGFGSRGLDEAADTLDPSDEGQAGASASGRAAGDEGCRVMLVWDGRMALVPGSSASLFAPGMCVVDFSDTSCHPSPPSSVRALTGLLAVPCTQLHDAHCLMMLLLQNETDVRWQMSQSQDIIDMEEFMMIMIALGLAGLNKTHNISLLDIRLKIGRG